MINFPSILKPVVNQGYSFGGSDNIIKTPVQGGNILQRKRFKTGVVSFSVAVVGGRTEKIVFTDWYYGKINAGADKFIMNLDSGRGIEEHICQIDPETIQWNGSQDPIWTINFNINAESTPAQFSNGEIFDLYEEYGSDLEPLLNRLAVFSMQDLADSLQ
jgi:hypothetical protein